MISISPFSSSILLFGQSGGTPVDPDAQAFITAAAITDPTQQSAVNQLVVDLKADGLWSKMKALYPFVGGTASQHKFNLKDPRDLDAAFRLSFLGGWTHSVNGATPNGVNSYANTFLIPNNTLTSTSNHYAFYSRTSILQASTEIGTYTPLAHHAIMLYRSDLSRKAFINGTYPTYAILVNNTNTLGFQIGTRTASNSMKLFWNNSLIGTNTVNLTGGLPLKNVYISALNNDGVAIELSSKQAAFASIGDGLTDTEAANFYTAVQTFQTTLGRSIGTQTVSDADAQAFVTNAGIVDQVEANAVNNLVIGMKADGVWSKMKAIYPFVGGTASSHSFNLRNTSQFQITWSGGVTHSSTGLTGNGVNGFADTFLNNNVMGQNDVHISIYTPAIATVSGSVIGSWDNLFGSNIYSKQNSTTQINTHGTRVNFSPFTAGFILVKRPNSTQILIQKNNSITTHSLSVNSHISTSFKLLRTGNFNGEYTNENLRLVSIGDNLTDTEASNFYTAVQTFQTALNRQV
jgi:hypothetical protein